MLTRRSMPPPVSVPANNAWAASRAVLFALAVAATTAFGGCAKRHLVNTDVEDTEYNRTVIEFCEEYRRAVERRNVALLLQMAHPRYYEDGGNVDASDDLDYAGLKDYLLESFRDIQAIRYEIRYRQVGEGRDNTIFVDYTYSASYKIPTEDGDVWRRRVEDNRLELVPDGTAFKIVAGM